MAEDLLRTLDLISTYTTDTDRPSYIEDPEDILNQNWYEQYRQLQPALEATEARASATIGPKETGPIEDVVGGFYASNKLAPIAAFIDDITPGIPFADIIPNPPDELPDGGNRMRNTLNTIAIVDALPGLAKMGTGAFKKGSDLYKNWKSIGLKKLWQKSSRAMNKPFTQTLKEYPVYIGNILVPPGKRIAKTVRKVQDEVAKELGSKTGFKRYLNTLLEQNRQITPSTNLPANRLRKDLISRLGEDKNLYQAYKNAVIGNINRAKYKVALPFNPLEERRAAGMNFQGLFTGPWHIQGYHAPSVLEKPLSALMRKSTKVHEYTHAAQVGRKIPERTLKEDAWNKPFTSVTGQIREDLFRAAGPKGSSIMFDTIHNEERTRILAGFQQLIDKNIKPDVMEKIDIYRGIKKGPKVTKTGVRIGSNENYLRSWQEVTARIGEMRHAEKLGKNYRQTRAYKDLRLLFDDDKFITKLKTNYWAAAPIGIGIEAMDDEVYEDLK